MATTTATPVASSIFATVTTLLFFFPKYPEDVREDVRRYFHHFVDDCKTESGHLAFPIFPECHQSLMEHSAPLETFSKDAFRRYNQRMVQNLVFKELVYANVWVYFPMTYFITFLVNDGSSTRFRCKAHGKELVVEETESESENDDIMIGIEPEKDHSSEDDIVIKIESKSSVYNWGEAIRQFAYECIAKASVEHTTINGRSISILPLQENTPVQKWLHVKIKNASSSIRLKLLASNLYVKDYIGPNNEKWKRFKEEG
ncbi:hypothetical protein Tsubulata_042566 [Turnera subulata]|uniref:rRNA N-glycosylase n=1 Tax=Turnera subulata TaxID=218843 RepID=A0A9Q0G3V6_9ROSI|nr:hypothetical protein Tsubulata_042566 [Turnera subulata]